MFVRKLLMICVSAFMLNGAGAQLPGLQQLDSLASLYIKALRNIPGESTWLQTDRPVYRVGDIIWFKAFVVNSISRMPSKHSSILYVDMVDERDSMVTQCLLNASLFKTDGSIVLADTLSSGHYWLRAYTKYSLSGTGDPMYVQAVYVINPLKPESRNPVSQKNTISPIIPADDSVRVAFFPEGGTVVGGANTVIAVKTTDAKGIPVSVSGFVKDNRDSVVAVFNTNPGGLGKVSFFCWTWHNYLLHITRNNKPDLRYSIPAVNLFAAQLAVIEKGGIRRLRVVLEDSIFRKDKVTYVLGVSGDSLCFSGVGRGSYDQVIPEYRFPNGIARFILFDEQQNFLSERSIYIDGDEASVKITTDKPVYAAREKVNLSIEVNGADKQPQVASFMAEVNDVLRESFYEPIKPLQVDTGYQRNNAWLAPLQKYSPEERELLLLSQNTGINQQVRQQLQKTVLPGATEDQDSSLYIKGRVLDNRGRPLQKKIVTLFGDMKTKVFLSDTTKQNGDFCFPFTSYDDKSHFNLQVTDLSGSLSPAKIVLDTMLHVPHVSTPRQLKQRFVREEIETARKALIIRSGKDTVMMKRGKEWLTDVTVTGLVKKDPGYDIKKRMSLFSKVISSEMLLRVGSNSLGNAIFRVPGIHLRNGYVTVQGGNSFGVGANTEPMLIIDGMPVPSDTMDKIAGSEPSPLLLALNRIDPATVDFIEVLTGPEAAIYGVRGGNGVIIVNTRPRMIIDNPNQENGIRNLLVKGFHVPETFEQRDYSLKENKYSKIPDTRSLIYWNGDGLTDANGKATLSFYTADAPAVYTVTVSGITAKGYRFQKQIQVNRK